MRNLLSGILLLSLCSLAPLPATAAKECNFDQRQSCVSFTLRHLGVVTVSGTFKEFKGDFYFDPADVPASSVQIKIQSGSIDSGNVRRDKDMRSKNFFWSEKYPLIEFESHAVQNITPTTFDVYGELTIKGIRKPAIFKTELLEKGTPETGGRPHFHSWTVIHRKDFDLGVNPFINPVLLVTNEELRIDLNVEGLPKENPKPAAS